MRSIAAVVFAGFSVAQSWAQVALTPSTPVITPSPVFVPGSPALGTVGANPSVTTNATLTALAQSLANLRANLEQTLPVLSFFNDNFDFVGLSDNGAVANGAAASPGNFSQNLATNFAANFAVNAAVPTGGSLFNNVANRTASPATGLPQGFATVPVTRDALRELLVLQSDMQRMLPILNALNGGTTNLPGGFTNLFGAVPNP